MKEAYTIKTHCQQKVLTALPQGRVSELLEAVLAYWHERMGVRLVSVAMQEVEKAFA